MRSSTLHSLRTKRHAIGVDITDDSVRIAECRARADNHIFLSDAEQVSLAQETVRDGRLLNVRKLRSAFRELCSRARIQCMGKPVILALPDCQVIAKFVDLPLRRNHSLAELQAFSRTTFQSLHYNVEYPVVRWSVTRNDEGAGQLMLYITSRRLIDQWRSFFQHYKMPLGAVEMRSHAIARALVRRVTVGSAIGIVDIGSSHVNVSIVSNHGLRLSHVFEGGVKDMMPSTSVETTGRMSRLRHLHSSTEIRNTTDSPSDMHKIKVRALADAIGDVLASSHESLTQCFITGDTDELHGIQSQLKVVLDVPISLGTPWLFRQSAKQNIYLGSKVLHQSDRSKYAAAIGLGMRGVNILSLHQGLDFAGSLNS